MSVFFVEYGENVMKWTWFENLCSETGFTQQFFLLWQFCAYHLIYR